MWSEQSATPGRHMARIYIPGQTTQKVAFFPLKCFFLLFKKNKINTPLKHSIKRPFFNKKNTNENIQKFVLRFPWSITFVLWSLKLTWILWFGTNSGETKICAKLCQVATSGLRMRLYCIVVCFWRPCFVNQCKLFEIHYNAENTCINGICAMGLYILVKNRQRPLFSGFKGN